MLWCLLNFTFWYPRFRPVQAQHQGKKVAIEDARIHKCNFILNLRCGSRTYLHQPIMDKGQVSSIKQRGGIPDSQSGRSYARSWAQLHVHLHPHIYCVVRDEEKVPDGSYSIAILEPWPALSKCRRISPEASNTRSLFWLRATVQL